MDVWGRSMPAMNDTTGFLVPDCLMNSAASSSAVPPISPIIMMPSVCACRMLCDISALLLTLHARRPSLTDNSVALLHNAADSIKFNDTHPTQPFMHPGKVNKEPCKAPNAPVQLSGVA